MGLLTVRVPLVRALAWYDVLAATFEVPVVRVCTPPQGKRLRREKRAMGQRGVFRPRMLRLAGPLDFDMTAQRLEDERSLIHVH